MKRPDILNDLLTRLDRGDWDRGDLLPPLRSLADKYETNPQTVSNALTALALLGRIHTTPRGSRVVAGRRGEIHLGHYRALTPGQKPTGTHEWLEKAGEGALESPTRIELLKADDRLATLLSLPKGSDVAVRHRTRTMNGHPVQYKRTALPKAFAELAPPEGGQPPMLTDRDIVTPEGKSIAQWLGMGVTRVEYRWSLAQADAEESKAMLVKEGVPVLRVVSRGLRQDDSVAFATTTTTPANTDAVMCIETEA